MCRVQCYCWIHISGKLRIYVSVDVICNILGILYYLIFLLMHKDVFFSILSFLSQLGVEIPLIFVYRLDHFQSDSSILCYFFFSLGL